ncbi:hypothetical protein H2198_002819 [Neophaeococcomyces mojaviensis]|uniref:Uncharacterized protein n=1 Tax=Neophaeococcomyces mojaviensis TaxID=3383035 RepID=A0ACC3ADF8_9EURO|nr:hypothetical protein H2198_002819 [Knufia sp. JES_112]
MKDVQAGLNVLITALSALIIFIFVRFSWQSGASQIAKNKAVPLSFILTINTPGKVLDALSILKFKLADTRKILAQCIIVVLFSITTLVSGPIARYATRITNIITHSEMDGYLSVRHHNSDGVNQVMWNLTEASLDRANFPTDQLLDYLPDTTSHWLYRQEEWNNTWSMTCQPSERTFVGSA